jgi:hypothetical protein
MAGRFGSLRAVRKTHTESEVMNTRQFLIGVSAAAALLSAASAGNSSSGPLNTLNNGLQNNWGAVYANLVGSGWMIGGDLRANATAIGNSFTASTEGSTFMFNRQIQMADVGATVKLDFGKVKGDVDIAAVGVCNNASLSTSGGYGAVYNDQRCATTDPFANVDVKLSYVGGNTTIAATSIANNLAMNVNDGAIILDNYNQTNIAGTYANVNVALGATGGDVAINAAAVGNNISISQGFGP